MMIMVVSLSDVRSWLSVCQMMAMAVDRSEMIGRGCQSVRRLAMVVSLSDDGHGRRSILK